MGESGTYLMLNYVHMNFINTPRIPTIPLWVTNSVYIQLLIYNNLSPIQTRCINVL